MQKTLLVDFSCRFKIPLLCLLLLIDCVELYAVLEMLDLEPELIS